MEHDHSTPEKVQMSLQLYFFNTCPHLVTRALDWRRKSFSSVWYWFISTRLYSLLVSGASFSTVAGHRKYHEVICKTTHTGTCSLLFLPSMNWFAVLRLSSRGAVFFKLKLERTPLLDCYFFVCLFFFTRSVKNIRNRTTSVGHDTISRAHTQMCVWVAKTHINIQHI